MSAYREFCTSRTVICWSCLLTVDVHYKLFASTFVGCANVLLHHPFTFDINAPALLPSVNGKDNGGSDEEVEDKDLFVMFIINEITANN